MLPFVIGAKRGLRPLLGSWVRLINTSNAVREPPAVPQPVALSKLKDSFNDATSVAYLEELERKFNENPSSIDKTWASFFTSLGKKHVTYAATHARYSYVMLITSSYACRSRCPRRGHRRGLRCVREGQNRIPNANGQPLHPDDPGEHEAPHARPLPPGLYDNPLNMGTCGGRWLQI